MSYPHATRALLNAKLCPDCESGLLGPNEQCMVCADIEQHNRWQLMTLSQKVTQYIKLIEASGECHDDVDAYYAPSECHGVVSKSMRKQAKELLDSMGYSDFDQFYNEVVARTNEKWAHDNLFPPESF